MWSHARRFIGVGAPSRYRLSEDSACEVVPSQAKSLFQSSVGPVYSHIPLTSDEVSVSSVSGMQVSHPQVLPLVGLE